MMKLRILYSQKILLPGKALYFDGIDDWAEVFHFVRAHGTVEVRATAKPENTGCIFHGMYGSATGRLTLYADGFLIGWGVNAANADPRWFIEVRNLFTPDGRWHEYVLRYAGDTGEITFSMDETEVWTGVWNGGELAYFTGIELGRNAFTSTQDYLIGTIDRVELRSNDSLVALWPIEEGEGTTTADVVGPYDLTIYGATWGDGRPPVPVFYRSLNVETLKRSIKLEVIG